MSYLRKLLNFLRGPQKESVWADKPISVASPADELPTAYRINITRALNGHIVHVLTHKSNPYGPDWTGDVTVVPEGADLMEAIKIGIAAAGLK